MTGCKPDVCGLPGSLSRPPKRDGAKQSLMEKQVSQTLSAASMKLRRERPLFPSHQFLIAAL